MKDPIEMACAEAEANALVIADVLAEEGIEFDDVAEMTIDFVIANLSPASSATFRKEIAAGRGAALLKRMVASLERSGSA